MRSHVFLQSIALFERRIAHIATVGLHVQMRHVQMRIQFGLRFAALRTQFTFEQFLDLMHFGNVIGQHLFITKAALALVAAVRVVNVFVLLSSVIFQ